MKTAPSPTKPIRHAMPPRTALTCVALLLLLASPAAFAYLDPSTGSMVVSAIVGIFASIALAVKTYWYKIKGWFRRGGKQDPASRDAPE
jgi:O-antigen/teichoic acid export membrane protein